LFNRPGGGEADEVGEIGRPLVQERLEKAIFDLRRHGDLEDQLRDGDREHAIAEGFESSCSQLCGHSVGSASVGVAEVAAMVHGRVVSSLSSTCFQGRYLARRRTGSH